MEENQTRKVIMMSLAGLLIGSLLFVFGISIRYSTIPLVINYLCAMSLYLCSFLAIYNNNKKEKYGIYRYLMVIAVCFMIFISMATIINLL